MRLSDMAEKKSKQRMYRIYMSTPKGPQSARFPARSIAHAIELAAGAWCPGEEPGSVTVTLVSERPKIGSRSAPSRADIAMALAMLASLRDSGVWAAYERGLEVQA